MSSVILNGEQKSSNPLKQTNLGIKIIKEKDVWKDCHISVKHQWICFF